MRARAYEFVDVCVCMYVCNTVHVCTYVRTYVCVCVCVCLCAVRVRVCVSEPYDVGRTDMYTCASMMCVFVVEREHFSAYLRLCIWAWFALPYKFVLIAFTTITSVSQLLKEHVLSSIQQIQCFLLITDSILVLFL